MILTISSPMQQGFIKGFGQNQKIYVGLEVKHLRIGP